MFVDQHYVFRLVMDALCGKVVIQHYVFRSAWMHFGLVVFQHDVFSSLVGGVFVGMNCGLVVKRLA